MRMKPTRRCCAFFIGFMAIISLISVFFGPGIIDRAITAQIPSRAMMTADNYNIWGQVPGKLNVTALLDFTFFNFTNPFEVLYLNHTPEFVETRVYSYQLYQEFLEPKFATEENGNEYVEFHPYQYYKEYGDANYSDLVTIPNLGPLVAWYLMKNSGKAKVCLEALVNLASALETNMGYAVPAQSVWTAFVSGNQSSIYDLIFKKAGVDNQTFLYIWGDKQYGWADPSTFKPWVIASLEGVDNTTSRLLMEYFDLSFTQMSTILTGQLKKSIQMMSASIANMFNCSTIPCDPKYLAYLQWAQQGVTMNLPNNMSTPSVFLMGNDTVSGYPEISYYLSQFFPQSVSDGPEYQNVTFSVELALRLFNRSDVLNQPLKNWDVLMHYGNLEFIFAIGEEYQKNGSLTVFQPMMDRFGLDSLQQTRVLYSYLDYFTRNFSNFEDQEGGSPQFIISGGQIAGAIYSSFVNLQEFLPLHLTSLYIYRHFRNMNYTCEDIIINSMNIEEYTEQQVCQSLNYTDEADSLASIKLLVASCWAQEGDVWDFLLQTTYLKRANLLTICFDSNTAFMQALTTAELALYDHYNCSSFGKRCNKFSMAVLQWSNSSITSNIPDFLNEDVSSTMTVSDWNPVTFPRAVEYRPVMSYLNKVFDGRQIPGWSYEKAASLLDFNHLSNSLVIAKTFLQMQNGLLANISEQFGVEDPLPLVYYCRYMMSEVGMAGFVQTRSVKELLWGYPDSFLANVSNSDPIIQGGDPSIRTSIVMLVNQTREAALEGNQTLYTGRGNISKVRSMRTVNGYNYVTSTVTKFNGNESYNETINPWAEEAVFRGCDGNQISPQKPADEPLYVYNAALFRELECEWDQATTVEKDGLTARRYKINPNTLLSTANNSENAKYYSNRWNGVMNLTSTQGAPIFLSKLHFLDADSDVQDNVKLYKDANKTQQIVPSSTSDDSYFDVEPISGASFGSMIKLQSGIYYEGDAIYSTSFDGILPLFSIQGGGAISTDAIEEMFGALRTVLLVRRLIVPVGLTLAGLQFIVAIYLYVTYRRSYNKSAEGVDEEEQKLGQNFNQSTTTGNGSEIISKSALAEPLIHLTYDKKVETFEASGLHSEEVA